MQGPDYLFAFMDQNFKFWSYNRITRIVSVSTQPYFMEFSPDGWDEIAIQNIRNKVYKSVDRSVTVPLAYVRDGATILKHIAYTKGFKEKVFLVAAAQELVYTPNISYKFWYKQVYRGEVDWGTFDHAGLKVTCATLEDGLPKYLKAGDKTVFEYPLDVTAAIKYKNDGVVLRQKAKFLVTNGGNLNNQGNHTVELVLLGIDGINVAIKGVERTTLVGSTGQNQNLFAVQNSLWFINSMPGVPISVSWDFFVTATIAPGIPINPAVIQSLTMRRIDPDGFVSNFLVLQQFVGGANVYRRNHYIGTATYTPPANGGAIFLVMSINVVGSSGDGSTNFVYDDEGYFNITNTSFRKDPTYTLALRLQKIFELIVSSLTAGAYQAYNSIFLNANADKVLTSGNAIRGISNPTIKISLEMFFQFLDSVWNVGLIDRGLKVDIDLENNIIDLNSVIDLPSPSVGTFRIYAAKELFVNELEIGFPEIRNDVGILNGKEEFNTKFVFSTDATTLTGKLSKISPVKTSCYDMEGLRINLAAADTTDNKNDNDVYAVHIKTTLMPATTLIPAHYLINRDLNPLITAGLTEAPSVYNLFFTPKRSFYRQGENVRGRFYLGDSTVFKFRTADQNKELICNSVVEKADVQVGQLATPKLIPWYLEMNIPIDYNVLSLLNINPLQTFRVPINGQLFIGALENIGINPSKNSPQKILLRGSFFNNYLKLISYNG